MTNQFSNSVIKVAGDGTVVGKYAVGKNPIGVATDSVSVWVANNGVAVTPSGIWVTNAGSDSISRR